MGRQGRVVKGFSVRRSRGFSLLEMLLVVGLLSLLAGFGTWRLLEYGQRKSVDAVIADVLTLAYAAQSYAANHGGMWPDAANPAPCQEANQVLLDEGYVGDLFASPWSDGGGTGYLTLCPLAGDDRQDTLQITFRVPVEFTGLVESRLPSTAIATPDPGAVWTTATHYLPLPRYHAGRVAVNEVAVEPGGSAATPAATCPPDRRQMTVQPMDICLPDTLVPIETCEDFSWTVQVEQGLGRVEKTVTRQICYEQPLSVRGYYTDVSDPDPLTGEQVISLYVTADGAQFHAVQQCQGQPVRFSIMEFCQ